MHRGDTETRVKLPKNVKRLDEAEKLEVATWTNEYMAGGKLRTVIIPDQRVLTAQKIDSVMTVAIFKRIAGTPNVPHYYGWALHDGAVYIIHDRVLATLDTLCGQLSLIRKLQAAQAFANAVMPLHCRVYYLHRRINKNALCVIEPSDKKTSKELVPHSGLPVDPIARDRARARDGPVCRVGLFEH
jgi:hypothetical protein